MTILPKIKWNDENYGSEYRSRTKAISKYFKTEYQKYLQGERAKDLIYNQLAGIYKYKGPVLEWYFRIKWHFEKTNYETYNQLIGAGAKKIYDLGCGYGYVSHFLKLRDPQRTILGFDYDSTKIAIARHNYLENENVTFEYQDIRAVKPLDADTILLADVLHYLSQSDQLNVLENCKNGLKPNGSILVREGMATGSEQHRWTKRSEKWSTDLLKFNKTITQLEFIDRNFLESWSMENRFDLILITESKKSSNALFQLKKISN